MNANGSVTYLTTEEFGRQAALCTALYPQLPEGFGVV